MELVFVDGAGAILVQQRNRSTTRLATSAQSASLSDHKRYSLISILPDHIVVQLIKPLLQLFVSEVTLFALAHEGAELGKVELAIVIQRQLRHGIAAFLAHSTSKSSSP